MTECRYKKRLQFYLDGWTDARNSRDIEKHLKHCPQCQVELTELEELSGSALEIVDQAPDKEYWDSFNNRVQNRIAARNIEPDLVEYKAPRFLFLRLASIFSILLVVLSISALLLFKSGGNSPRLTAPGTASVQNSPDIAISHTDIITPTNPAAISTKTPAAAPPQLETAGRQAAPASHADVGEIVKLQSEQHGNSALALSVKDLTEQFRETSLIDKAQPKLDTDARAFASRSFDPGLLDPSYRLRNSFVAQRLLAGLGMNTRNGAAINGNGSLLGFNSSSRAYAWDDIQNDLSSTWGYLRVASDTSKSSEIKKYFIELEIMQTR